MKKKLLSILVILCMILSLAACGSAPKAEPDENGNYVVNGSFEDADFTGWTVTNIDDSTEELDIYTRETDCCDGVQSLHFYSGSSNVNFTAEQTISGLEKGSYKLTGYIQGEAAGDENAEVFFYAVINGKTLLPAVGVRSITSLWSRSDLWALSKVWMYPWQRRWRHTVHPTIWMENRMICSAS